VSGKDTNVKDMSFYQFSGNNNNNSIHFFIIKIFPYSVMESRGTNG
jgi:hypothetical protein